MKILSKLDGADKLKQDSDNRFVTDEQIANWNSKGVVNIGAFNDQTELIAHVLMNQLPTGQYAFFMNNFPHFVLLEQESTFYRGTFHASDMIFNYFVVSIYGEIQDLKTVDLRDLVAAGDLQVIVTDFLDYINDQDALKADKTYVDSQDALKADITYVELKADKTYVDSQDALKADATSLTALTNLVPAATGLITVTGKNQYYPIAEDNTGAIIGRRLLNVWNGTRWVTANASGFGYAALRYNTGAYANGFGDAALRNNTGANANGFGYYALSNNTGASANGFGYSALSNNTGASANGFGSNALSNNTGASANGFGYSALSNNTGASANGFGSNALRNNTGANNSAFGHNANNTTDTTIQALTNTTCLGANTLPNKSNQVVLGDGKVDTVKMGGTARTPASSTAPGVKGETCWDTNYFYICVATDIWKRILMEAW